MPIRKPSTRLLVDISRSLLNHGVLLIEEYAEIRDAIVSLSTSITKTPSVEDHFLSGPEVAEKLGISFSQFKQLFADGELPFKRHRVGNKSTRYLFSEVLHYMEVASAEGRDENPVSQDVDCPKNKKQKELQHVY